MDEHNAEDIQDPHKQLGLLLQKPRSARRRAHVDRILQSSIELEDKIRRIEALDRKPDSVGDPAGVDSATGASTTGAHAHAADTPDETAYQTAELEVQSLREIKRNRSRVKQLILPNSFWNFLLVDLAKIRRYREHSRVLTRGFFPTTLKIQRDIPQLIGKVLKPTAEQIHSGCTHLLATAWMYLHKHDYNLVAVLDQLSQRILELDTIAMKSSAADMQHRCAGVERLFLSLYQESDHFIRLFETLQQYNEAHDNEEDRKERARLLYFTRKLLQENSAGPTLTDLILAINIARTKAYLSLEQLIQPDCGQLISYHEFDCSPETRDEIRSYLQKVEHSMIPLVREYRKAAQLQQFLPREYSSNERYTMLASWYASHLLEDDPSAVVSFQQDEKDVMVFVPRVIEFLGSDIIPFLSEPVTLTTAGKISLFEHQPFNADFERLSLLRSKFDRLSFLLPQLPVKRFHDIKHNRVQPVSHEAEAAYLTDSTFSILMQAAQRIIEETAGAIGSVIHTHHADTLQLPAAFSAMTLQQALHHATAILLLLAKWNEQPEIAGIESQQHKVADELSKKIRIFERIAHPSLYAYIRDTYGF